MFSNVDIPNKEGWIASFYVSSEHCGKIGRKLVESVLEYIDSHGVEEMGSPLQQQTTGREICMSCLGSRPEDSGCFGRRNNREGDHDFNR